MAEKMEIITTIDSAGQPISLSEIAKELHVQASAMGTQIARLKKDALLDETEKDRYVLSDKGKELLEKEKEKARKLLEAEPPLVGGGAANDKPDQPEDENPDELPDNPPAPTVGQPETSKPPDMGKPIPSEEDAGLSDYAYFYKTGIRLGVKPDFASIVTAHVWSGGQYDDLAWVWNAFREMQVRSDVAPRWWHAWRTHLQKTVPPGMQSKVESAAASAEAKTGEDTGAAVKESVKTLADRRKDWTHILVDDVPQFVGEGKGDMTYDDAKSLAEVRTTARARAPAASATPALSAADELDRQIKMLTALASVMKGDGNGRAKSFMVTTPDDGGPAEITEIPEGQPIVAPAPRAQVQQGKTWLVDDDGAVQEVEPGKPVVMIRDKKKSVDGGNGGGPGNGFYYLNPATGAVELWDASKGPLNLSAPPKPAQDSMPMVNLGVGPDGKPVVFDIKTYFMLEDHKQELQQKKESFDMKMGIGKEFRGLLGKGVRALGNMAGEEESLEDGSLESNGQGPGAEGAEAA